MGIGGVGTGAQNRVRPLRTQFGLRQGPVNLRTEVSSATQHTRMQLATNGHTMGIGYHISELCSATFSEATERGSICIVIEYYLQVFTTQTRFVLIAQAVCTIVPTTGETTMNQIQDLVAFRLCHLKPVLQNARTCHVHKPRIIESSRGLLFLVYLP